MINNLSNYNAIRRTVVIALIILLGIVLVMGLLHFFFGDLSVGGIKWFNLDKERNLPTWFSGALFLLFGCAAFVAFYQEMKINAVEKAPLFRLPWLWLFTGFAGIGMSLDEITVLHENLFWREVREATLESNSAWVYATQWQILFAPVIVLIFGYFIVFFYNRYISSQLSYKAAFAGIGCWLLALLPEGLRETFKQMGAGWYSAEVVFEESMEMAGAVLLMASIVFYTMDIALDLTEERRKRLQSASKFLTRRAVLLLTSAIIGFAIIGAVIYMFANMMAKSGAEKPDLQKRVIEESQEIALPVPEIRPETVWFGDIASVKQLSAGEAKEVAAFTGALVFARGQKLLKAPVIFGEDKLPRIVFVSIGDVKSPVRVLVGCGNGISNAVENALAKIDLSKNDSTVVKIDIVNEVISLPETALAKRQPVQYERSLYGMAFDDKSALAFLPEEMVARTLMDSENIIHLDNVRKYLRKNLHDNGNEKGIPASSKTTLYRFRCFSFFTDGKELVGLYRGHRFFSREMSKGELLAPAISGGAYLSRNAGKDGNFTYAYMPKTNETSDEYNILRHAGTVYSLLELYRVTGDKELLNTAEAGLEYLLKAAKPLKKGADEFLCVTEDNEVKLGGNALAAVALAEHIKATGDKKYLPQLLELVRWIHSVQDENGNFAVHKIKYPSGEAVKFESEYYPGEAMLALMRAYEITLDKKWLDAAEKAARYIINVRDKGLSPGELINDHWFLYALDELYEHSSNKAYAEHAWKIAQGIIEDQNGPEGISADWAGGYYKNPRTAPAATRTEGLCAAYRIFRVAGMKTEAQATLESIKAGIAFQLQTQFATETVLYLDYPARALGGFHEDLTNYTIQIDYNQHNISAILALYDILYGDK